MSDQDPPRRRLSHGRSWRWNAWRAAMELQDRLGAAWRASKGQYLLDLLQEARVLSRQRPKFRSMLELDIVCSRLYEECNDKSHDPRLRRSLARSLNRLVEPFQIPPYKPIRMRGPVPNWKKTIQVARELQGVLNVAEEDAKEAWRLYSRAADRFQYLAGRWGDDNVPPKGDGCYRARKPPRELARAIAMRQFNIASEVDFYRKIAPAKKAWHGEFNPFDLLS